MVTLENVRVVTHNSDLYWKEVSLRYNELRKPLGLDFDPEQLAAEDKDVHVVYAINDEVFGCMVLTTIDGTTLKMRQVAVDKQVQEVGIGSILVQYAEDYARTHNYKLLMCHARDTAVPFYLKQGWAKVGDEFTEVHIPHFRMEKWLD